jgi:glycerophosphoryl diester phosphodiesterase
MLRVGHGGAGALARGNTLASFDAALEAGVDMIEFDVRVREGRLVLAHTPFDAHFRCGPTLTAALRHLSSRRFRGLRFDVDVKQAGIEAATLYALESAGLTDRCLISCCSAAVLDRFRQLDPSVHLGVSVRRRRDRPAALAALEARRFDAVMAHHRIVDPAFSAGVRERAGELFAWTVDERAGVERMRAAGVSGVISNDPRLFGPAAAQAG